MFKRLLAWLPLGRVPELSAMEIARVIEKEPVQLLDVRSVFEWKQSRIDSAMNVPVTQLSEKKLKSLNLNPTQKTIVICLSAHRSIPVVRRLQTMGFNQVYQLEDGMRAWWKNELPTVSGQ